MSLMNLVEANTRIYDSKWDTPERRDMLEHYQQKYGEDVIQLPLSWIDVVGPLLDDLVASHPGIRISSVKQKVATLRIELDPRQLDLEDALATIASFPLISRDVYAQRP